MRSRDASFKEPLSNPVWQKRSAELARAMGSEIYKTASLLHLARMDLFWSADQTRQVLAAGEGTVLYERGGMWRAVRQSAPPVRTDEKDKEERTG